MANGGVDFGGQCGGDPLVGVHEEHPVGVHGVQGGLALGRVVVEGPEVYLRPGGLGQILGAVRAARIPDDDRVG